jgi:hypothetical protein
MQGKPIWLDFIMPLIYPLPEEIRHTDRAEPPRETYVLVR